MKKTIFTAVLIGSMLVSASSVFAAGNGAGMRGSGDCDRLRDGSCLVGTGDQDRLRDGSCLIASGDQDQVKDQDKLMDGSCLTA